MHDALKKRLARVYAAIDEAVKQETLEFKPTIRRMEGNTFTAQVDFRGGASDEQLENCWGVGLSSNADDASQLN